MALSGTFYGPWLGSGYQRVYLTWSATQNVGANTSTISASLIWENAGATLSSSVAKTASITIGGVVAGSTSTAVVGISANTTRTIVTGSREVAHNSDGTLSVAISGTFDIKFTLGGTYYASTSASGTATLNTIPRTSIITSFPSFTIGNGVTVTAPRNSSGFTNEFHIYVGGTPIYTTPYLSQDSYTFTGAQLDGIYAHIPNANSVVVTAYVNTFSGATLIGQSSATASATVGSDIIPTFTSLTSAETVTAVSNLALGANNYAQGISRIKFTVNGAVGAKSSSISSYNISFDGISYGQNGVTNGINTTGTIRATATVTDSRGMVSASKYVDVSILPYAPPNITTFTVVRDTVVTTAKTVIGATISSLNSKNQLTYKVESKLKTSDTWDTKTASTSLSLGVTSLSVTPSYTTYDAVSSYDFRVTVSDKVGNSDVVQTAIGTEEVALSWGKTGIGVGKIWERGALDVVGKIYTTGDFNTSTTSHLMQTPHGNIQFGPMNTTWAHIYTDRPNFYFNKPLFVNGTAVSMYGHTHDTYGSNANGYYRKFEDGTLICWATRTFSTTVALAWGSLFYHNVQSWTFPVAFVGEKPVCTAYATDSGAELIGVVPNSTLTNMTFYGLRPTSVPASTAFDFRLMAIGRWK